MPSLWDKKGTINYSKGSANNRIARTLKATATVYLNSSI
jgi:hypothetical protein